MRPANPELQNQIVQKTLELLLDKDPESLGMREIAAACNVTAPTIYHYFKDKTNLFKEVSLFCLQQLKDFMTGYIEKESGFTQKSIAALKGFRDWCFKNPKIAFLIMGKIKVADDASSKDVEPYYICFNLGEQLLAQCTIDGKKISENPALDTGIIVSGLWGCIEQTLLKRTAPEFWNKGTEFSDHYIKMVEKAYFSKN